MKCSRCGMELIEGSLFCHNCGSLAEPVSAEPAAPAFDSDPAQAEAFAASATQIFTQDNEPENQATIFCGHCGTQVPAAASVCGSCGLPPTTVVTPPAAPKKKKSHLGLWIFAAVAGLLVIAVIAGLCTNWFGFYGPGTQIAIAAENTLKAGNFTVDLSMTTESILATTDTKQKTDGTIQVVLDAEDRKLTLLAELKVENEPATLAIYDEYLIFGVNDYFMKLDISDSLEDFFDSYESANEMDWEELLESLDEDLYDEVSEVIDFDELEKCLSAYGRKLNSNQWLKENAGYAFSMEDGVRIHQFKPKNYQFLTASAECFEEAFIDEDDYEDMMDTLKDKKIEINDMEIELCVGIKSNQLTFLEYEISQKSSSTKMELEFDKIGETEIDEDKLEQLLEKAF